MMKYVSELARERVRYRANGYAPVKKKKKNRGRTLSVSRAAELRRQVPSSPARDRRRRGPAR
jgi:hypothetical protein